MAKKRRYHPSVSGDLAAAVSYYDDISVDLGNRFRASVRDRLRVISDRPESFGCIHDEMRAAMTDRFPYVILFEAGLSSLSSLAFSMLPPTKRDGSHVRFDAGGSPNDARPLTCGTHAGNAFLLHCKRGLVVQALG